MRALALLAWLLALLLAIPVALSLRPDRAAVERPAASLAPELQLWRQPAVPPAAVEAASVAVPNLPAAREMCARLGVFPTAAWAEAVLSRLAGPAEAGAVPAAWRVDPVGEDGFYIVLRGESLEALRVRLDALRPALGALVSRSVQPESCI